MSNPTSTDPTTLSDPFYTPREVQAQLKIGRTFFFKVVREKKLHVVRFGRSLRVSGPELQRFIRESSQQRSRESRSQQRSQVA